MVSRFREELDRQDTTEDAVAATVATAGRTVAVSGVTVAVALASLMLFPEMFLRSMGYGGVATVLVDMLAALTVLPALLAVLGPRVNALRVRRYVPRAARDEQSGAWYRIARSVMRRPVAYVVVILLVLLALASPFHSITWGGTDARALPAGAPARVVAQALSRDFPGNPSSPIEVEIRLAGPATAPAQRAALATYVRGLDHVSGVSSAALTGVRGDIARVDLRYAADPYSATARDIVAAVCAVPPPAGGHAYVGGVTAQLVDELSSLGHTLPWMALVMCLATFVLLFLAFGSVVLPLKAIVMNVLSLSATFGVIVWIFQEGHLSGLLRFTPTGTIDPSMPILMLAIIFGLSMDYEVFLFVPDPRTLRRDRGQLRRRGQRAAAHRGPHYQPGVLAGDRGGGVLRVRDHVHQADGRGHDRRPGGGRHYRPGPAGARDHAAARPGELVGARAAAPRLPEVRHPRGGNRAARGRARPGMSPPRA
jgi:uncharacterized membrane protein YdfJ with MMPL/SSD domain